MSNCGVRSDGQTINIYIDGANGNDSRSGLRMRKPLKSLEGFYEKYSEKLMEGSRVIVHLAGAGGFGADATGVLEYTTRGVCLMGGNEYNMSHVFRGPNMVPATLASGSTSVDYSAQEYVDQDGNTDAAGLRTKITFSGTPGWTVDDLLNKPVYLSVRRDDDLVMFEAPITGNGADYLIVDFQIPTGTILATDNCEIVTPGVLIKGDQDDFNAVDFGGGNFGPGQVVVNGTGGVSDLGFNNADGMGATFERIGFDSLSCIGVEGLTFDRCTMGTFVTIRGGSCGLVNVKCNAFGLNWSCRGFDVEPKPRKENVNSPSANLTLLSQLICVGGPLNVGGSGASSASMDGQYGISVYKSFGDGILISGPSVLTMRASRLIGGSGNTGIGIRARWGGKALVNAGNQTSIKGTAGDVKAGQNAAVSHGTDSADALDSSAVLKIYG